MAMRANEALKEDIVRRIPDKLEGDVDFIRDGPLAFMVLRKELGKIDEGKSAWRDISTDDIRGVISSLKKKGQKALEGTKVIKSNFLPMEAFNIIMGGASRDYWLEAEVDVDAFRVSGSGSATLSDITSKVRVASINDDLFSSPVILGNSFDTHRFTPNVYSFTSAKKEMKSDYSIPKNYLVDYEVQEENAFGEKEEGPSETAIRDFASSLIRLVGLQLLSLSIYGKEFQAYKRSAPKIRERIQKLNKRIDTLLQGPSDAPKSKKTEEKKEEMGEVALLHNASINFTQLMELDEKLSNNILILNDNLGVMERMEADLGTRKIGGSDTGTVVIDPLIDKFRTMRNTVIFAFNNLRENIENSQTRLRNTIDSFKIYQENRRRTATERSEKTFNTIFILLAVLTMGDAVGNFLVFGYVEKKYLLAGLSFAGVLIVLIGFFGLVYMFLLKKMFREG